MQKAPGKFTDITIDGHQLCPREAFNPGSLKSETVLTHSPWGYVEMWLKQRQKQPKYKEALSYWNQAQDFYKASVGMHKNSAALPAYYCILNATKTLLAVNGGLPEGKPQHGVTGEYVEGRGVVLKNEGCKIFKGESNNLYKLLRQLHGEKIEKWEWEKNDKGSEFRKYSLKTVLYNIPFIHRAFVLTYPGTSELFIPLINPKFVHDSEHNIFFQAKLNAQWSDGRKLRYLPEGYKVNAGNDKSDEYLLNFDCKHKWNKNETSINWYLNVRERLRYIYGTKSLWYLKTTHKEALELCTLPLVFAAMHLLSEIARYNPQRLQKHFEAKHNWLLSEFLEHAPSQFINRVASEITGHTFLPPGFRKESFD